MPNKNYIGGRSYEYETMREWEAKGYACIRASGSHGTFDVIAFRPDRIIELIQCKRVTEVATANRIIKAFQESMQPSKHYHQVIAVKIKGTKKPLTYTL